MAGRGGAVERRDFFSAMDGVGEPRIWGAAIYFLPAAVLDAGCGAGHGGAVECGAGSFYCRRADYCGSFFVCAGAAISAERRGAFWSGLLCSESVCAADRLYAQRFCGATGLRAAAAGGADGAAALWDGGETPAFPAAGPGVFRGGVRG